MTQCYELFTEGQKIVLRDTENPSVQEVFLGVSHERIFIVKGIDPVFPQLIPAVRHSQWLYVFDFLLNTYVGRYSGWYFTARKNADIDI